MAEESVSAGGGSGGQTLEGWASAAAAGPSASLHPHLYPASSCRPSGRASTVCVCVCVCVWCVCGVCVYVVYVWYVCVCGVCVVCVCLRVLEFVNLSVFLSVNVCEWCVKMSL